MEGEQQHLLRVRLEHLASLTTHAPGMLGVVITFDAKKKEVLRAAKVMNGVVERDWLEVESNKR